MLISLLLGCQLHAQNFLADWFGGPSRKELHSENDRLRESLDSLQILVDSLEQSYSQVESELFALIEGNSPEADSVVVEYTPEMTDSLLHLWYKNSFQGDFEIPISLGIGLDYIAISDYSSINLGVTFEIGMRYFFTNEWGAGITAGFHMVPEIYGVSGDSARKNSFYATVPLMVSVVYRH